MSNSLEAMATEIIKYAMSNWCHPHKDNLSHFSAEISQYFKKKINFHGENISDLWLRGHLWENQQSMVPHRCSDHQWEDSLLLQPSNNQPNNQSINQSTTHNNYIPNVPFELHSSVLIWMNIHVITTEITKSLIALNIHEQPPVSESSQTNPCPAG